MEPSYGDGNFSRDTNGASGNFRTQGIPISRNSSGKTGNRENGLRATFPILNGVVSWMEAKSSEISTVGILLSVLLVLVLMAVGAAWVKTNQVMKIYMNGRVYELAGLGTIDNNGQELYAPIYREVK